MLVSTADLWHTCTWPGRPAGAHLPLVAPAEDAEREASPEPGLSAEEAAAAAEVAAAAAAAEEAERLAEQQMSKKVRVSWL